MAKSSRFFKVDDDVLMEIIYHDQSNPIDYAIETDDNGSEMYFVGTDGITGGERLLIHQLGSSVVNFEVEEDAIYKFLKIENVANRTLVLAPGNTYQFDLSALGANAVNFDINDTTGIKTYNAGTQVFSYQPLNTGEYQYTYFKTGTPNIIFSSGKVSVLLKANPAYAMPNEDTGNSLNTGPGQPNRYHAVATNTERTKFALLDSQWNYVQNSLDWNGDSYSTINASLLSNTTNINSVVYETIRLHLRSGYNFSARNYQGFMLEVRAPRVNGTMNSFTQLVYLNSSDYEIQNPEPFILSETLYSKFIEVKVPSIKDLVTSGTNQDFFDSFYGTSSGEQIDPTAQYEVSFKLIDVYYTLSGFEYVETSEETTFAVAVEDEFVDITASVIQSVEGDYFELVGQYNGSAAAFNNYLINRINSSSDDLTVYHDISVFEQIGTSFTETYRISIPQAQNFDEPILFRPVLKNAGTAVSFTIDYDLRIFNETDNTQIVKSSSWNSLNSGWSPAKFGKKLQNIVLKNPTLETKVYNRLPVMSLATASEKLLNFGNQSSQTKFVQTFIERLNVITSLATVSLEGALAVETGASNFFGEGLAELPISPVDTFVKFKIAKENEGDINAINLQNTETLYLMFNDGGNTTIKLANVKGYKGIDSSMGEVLFKIDAGNANLIRGFINKKFYITTYNGTSETMLYSGNFINA